MKLAAVRRAFLAFFGSVRMGHVPHNTGGQPRGWRRTLALARRRARRALRGADYGVGIESGVNARYVLTACVILNGRRVGVGFGPTFRLPRPVPRGRTMGEMFGNPREGAVSVLSKGRLTRGHLCEDAARAALTDILTLQRF